MSEIIVKYFAISFCAYYIFYKSLNLQISVSQFNIVLLTSAILAVFITYVRNYIPAFTPVIIILSLSIVTFLIFKFDLSTLLTTVILSCGLSYACFAIATLLLLYPFYLIHSSTLGNNDHFYLLLLYFSLGVVQTILVIIPFQFKRLKNGLPFLLNPRSNTIGLYISISLLLIFSVFNNQSQGPLYLILFIVCYIICFALFFWRRSRLTQTYIEHMRARELTILTETLQEKELLITNLQQHNENLAAIIHKDNKLIPALELAVRDCITLTAQQPDAANAQKCSQLLLQLEQLSQERRGIVSSYENQGKKLPPSGSVAVDTVLNYMLRRALEQKITLDVSILENVEYILDKDINSNELNTLLADLVENAIIAVSHVANDSKDGNNEGNSDSNSDENSNDSIDGNKRGPSTSTNHENSDSNIHGQRILVQLCLIDCNYVIAVYDSGLAFPVNVLSNLGFKKITSHAAEGGSGIGIVTVFDIIKRRKASFVIEEYTSNRLFTKKVAICFDGLGQYRIFSDRWQELARTIVRPNTIIAPPVDN